MSREKQLAKNTLIYMIGNFTSRFLGFLLLPLYTVYLTESELGRYDVITTTISIIIPIVTLQINDSLYRYLLDSNSCDETDRIISNSVFVTAAGIAILCVGFIAFIQISELMSPLLILGYILVTILSGLWQQVARGLRFNAVYSIAGVIFTAVTIITNIILIIGFKMKLEALFYANVAASIALIVYVESRVKIIGHIKRKYFEPFFIRELVKYSIPLLPNSLNWWVIGACSRYSLGYFIGENANGIFAATMKFPSILLAFNSIFNLAWQESAIQEYGSEDKNRYYSSMFNMFMKFQFGFLIGLIPVTKWLMQLMVKKGFYEAWQYIPMLYISTVFQAFATFYGTGYLSSKDTKGAFTTSVAAAAVNIISCLVFIPVIGIQGASLASLLAFGCMWILRLIQTRKYFNIKIEKMSFAILLALSIIYSLLYYLENNLADAIMLAAAIPVFYFFNRELSMKLLGFTKNILVKIKSYGKA